MKRVKKMNSGGFVGKKKPDEERPINERLAEREFRGDDGDDGGSVRLMGIGGRGGPAGTVGFVRGSMSIPVSDSVSVEPWVSAEGSSRFKNSKGAGVSVSKKFARGGVVDPWNYKK